MSLIEFTQVGGKKIAINPAAVATVQESVCPYESTNHPCTAITMTTCSNGWSFNVYIDAPYEAVAGPLGLP